MAAFETFGRGIETAISGFAESASAALIPRLAPVIATALTILFIAKAWDAMISGRRGAVADGLLTVLRVAFVAWFGLNAGHFTAYAIGGITGLEAWLLESVPGAPANSWSAIDRLWEAASEGTAALWSLMGSFGVTKFGEELLLAVSVVLMSLLGVLLTASALGVILLAKVTLAVTLGFGPLFICTLMFRQTAQFFSAWLRTALAAVMTLVMAATVLLFFSGVFAGRVEEVVKLAEGGAGAETFGMWLQLGVTVAIVLTATTIVRMIPGIASGLTGGLTLGSAGLGEMLESTARPALNAAGGALAGSAWAGGGRSQLGAALLGSRVYRSGAAMPSAAAGAAFSAATRGIGGAASRIRRMTGG